MSEAQQISAASDKFAKGNLDKQEGFDAGAAWVLKHTRAEDDRDVAKRMKDAFQLSTDSYDRVVRSQAERIKELEAANAKLMDEFDKNITTLGQYLFYPHPKELLDRIKELEAENAALQRRIQELMDDGENEARKDDFHQKLP